ncbi:hypothetical protein F511_26245 [Dorcoceras hygrometricum]|uniref:Dystroglycan-like n=1 Tax=Dorcoceras hygrometricum TaxID=472368 RepID=A0A2Z7APN1_9LAMI|nr:hypothetical protein F511_26245 [Dorcoceras hygrometricum]
MESSLIRNTIHVLFDYVLAMDDEGIVAIFKALVASGLKGFLGCPAVIYEDALIEFFQHGSVRDGMVVSTIQGKTVEFIEEIFVGTFELPMDGLTDLNEVPKDLVFYTRSIFSFAGELVSTSWKKREMKIEFRLLSDILAKSIFMKAGSFDAVTHERFLMMAAINGGININWSRVLFNIFKDMVTPGSKQARGYAVQIFYLLKKAQDLELGDFKAFPPLKILTEKTVNRYIAINDKISVEDVEGVAGESRVNKIPMKKVVSKKRPSTAVDEHISKKKRTGVGKAAKSLAIVTVAQEAIPLQIVEPIRAVPAVLPSKPKRKAPKRRLKFPVESDDEIVEEETDVGGIAEKDSVSARADVVDKEISTADDMDNIIEQAVQRVDEKEHWFNVSYEEFVAREADRMVESGSDTDEEIVADKVTGRCWYTDGDWSRCLFVISLAFFYLGSFQFGKSITIRRVNEGDWYKNSLPKIRAAAKGKAPLQERDPIKGNPAKEIFSLICADIEILVQIREQVIDEVEQFFNSFSFKKMVALKIEDIYAKEEQVLTGGETDSTRIALQRRMFILTKYRELLFRKFLEIRTTNFVPGQPSSAIDLKVLNMLSNLHLFVIEELKTQMQSHGLQWELSYFSRLFEGKNRDRGAVIARSNMHFKSSCWIRTMIRVDGSWAIEPCAGFWKKIPKQLFPSSVAISPKLSYRCLSAFYEIVTTRILLAEPLGSLAFKMVQVRQLVEEQQVKLEISRWVALCLSKAYVFRV